MPDNQSRMPSSVSVQARIFSAGSARIAEALAVACDLELPELANLIWNRLTDNGDERLSLGIGESPVRIFIDLARYGNRPDLADRIRLACRDLMIQEWRRDLNVNVSAMAELCTLAFRSEAILCIQPLADMLEALTCNQWKTEFKDLSLRALKSFGGLLALRPDLKTQRYRAICEEFLNHCEQQRIALTILLTVWPHDRDYFVSKLPESKQHVAEELTNDLQLANPPGRARVVTVTDVADRVSQALSVSQDQGIEIFNAVVTIIAQSLQDGEDIELQSSASFRTELRSILNASTPAARLLKDGVDLPTC
jgi:nucleoid DNA-binding protein